MEYTLNEAFAYYHNNKLGDWLQSFLRAEEVVMPNPNYALADGLLLEDRLYFCPVSIPLDELQDNLN